MRWESSSYTARFLIKTLKTPKVVPKKILSLGKRKQTLPNTPPSAVVFPRYPRRRERNRSQKNAEPWRQRHMVCSCQDDVWQIPSLELSVPHVTIRFHRCNGMGRTVGDGWKTCVHRVFGCFFGWHNERAQWETWWFFRKGDLTTLFMVRGWHSTPNVLRPFKLVI